MNNSRIKMILGNWKSNGTLDEVITFIAALENQVSSIDTDNEIGVCFPNVYLDLAVQLQDNVFVGAQNVSQYGNGAYTGEVTAAMLADIGCTFALVGHSERRHLFGETDEVVATKFANALADRIIPVLCVGETLEERKANKTFDVIQRQLLAVLNKVGPQGINAGVIAYEPVWAIGTGVTASPEQAQEVHSFIRNYMIQEDPETDVYILYGGSVKADNATELFKMPDIDGALVGGASMNVDSFMDIYKAACLHTTTFASSYTGNLKLTGAFYDETI